MTGCQGWIGIYPDGHIKVETTSGDDGTFRLGPVEMHPRHDLFVDAEGFGRLHVGDVPSFALAPRVSLEMISNCAISTARFWRTGACRWRSSNSWSTNISSQHPASRMHTWRSASCSRQVRRVSQLLVLVDGKF